VVLHLSLYIRRCSAVRIDGKQEVRPAFGCRFVLNDYAELEDELVLAYAACVHKSRGSPEYPCVIMPLPTAYVVLKRTLVYTTMTGDKRVVVSVAGVKENRRPREHPIINLINW
jgi:ATP-dependent exoDNAse (exonuclease V) alpha subunit